MMRKLHCKITKTLAVFLLAGFIPVVHAEIAIITNPDVKEIGLSKSDVADIYLGNRTTYADGSQINPIDQSADSQIREEFYKSVVRMSASAVNRYWSKLEFTGKGTPPRVISGDEAVRNWVASHPGAIGYIDGKYLDNSVKVVLIIP